MKNSFFDGTALQLIGWTILIGLLTTVTFGIGFPWGLCMMERWKAKHTVVSSARLKFVGTGAELFWIWIFYAIAPGLLAAAAYGLVLILLRPFIEHIPGEVWSLLIVVIGLGVAYYGFFAKVQIQKWMVKHTEFEDYPANWVPVQNANPVEKSFPVVSAPASVAKSPEIVADGTMEAVLSLGTLFAGVPCSIVGLGLIFFNRGLEGAILFVVGIVLLLVSYFKQ